MADPQPPPSTSQVSPSEPQQSNSMQPAEGSPSHDSPAQLVDPQVGKVASQPVHSDIPNGRASTSSKSPAGQDPTTTPPSDSQPTQVPPSNSSLTSAPSGKDRHEDSNEQKASEKDRASLNSTLTGTHTHTRTHSSRRREAKSSSDVAHASSTAAEDIQRPKSPRKKLRNSLFSRIIQVLIPCVGPSSRSHDVEQPPTKPTPKEPEEIKETKESTNGTPPIQPEPPVPEREPTPPPKPTEEVPPPVVNGQTTPQQVEAEAEPEPEVTKELPVPLTPVEVPEPSQDVSVIVPPTPTKILTPEETAGVTSGAVQPPGSSLDTPRENHRAQESENESDGSTSFTEDDELDEGAPMDEVEDDEERLIMNGGAGIPIGPDGIPRPLLPPVSPKHVGKKCLVLDLDETLVHSSFKSIQQADYVVPVEIEYHWHNVYVIKRPGVDNFLKKMGEIYEVVVFTASLSKYADPVLDKLDIHRVVSHRLFRESCYNHRGNYVKDLSQLGRPISDTIIIDNSPASYIFHPNNAVPVSSWFTDPHDQELSDLVPFLTDLATVDDVRGVLDGGL